MKKTILSVAILAAGIFAVASVNAGVSANAGSASLSGSQSQSGAASYSNTGAATAGNAQSVNILGPEGLKYSGSYDVRNVPDVTTIIPGMTAPCMISVGVSGSGVGFGFGVGGGIEDKECTRRETARSLVALGKTDAAVRLFCGNPDVAKLLEECNVPAPAPLPTGPEVSYNPATRSTKVGGNGYSH